jgi:hypothetical protein
MSNLRLPFPIVPAAAGEPSHYAKYGVGGLHCVETANDLSGISENLKEPGMIVFVSSTKDLYTWTGSFWVSLGYVQQGSLEEDIDDIKDLLDWKEFD